MDVPPEVLLWEAVELPDGLNEDDRRICDFAKFIVQRVFDNAGRAGNGERSPSATDFDAQ